jgi:hypothetical protein
MQSCAWRQIGPILSSVLPAVITPARLTRPKVGAADDPASAQRGKDRTTGIGADRKRHWKAGRGGRGRTCGRSARSLLEVPRVVSCGRRPLIAERQLAGRQLGHEHRTRFAETLDDRGVALEGLLGEGPGAPARRIAVGRNDVLHAVRDPVQRAAILASRDLRVRRGRLAKRALLGQRRDAVDLRVVPLQTRNVHHGQCRRGQDARAQELSELRRRPERHGFEVTGRRTAWTGSRGGNSAGGGAASAIPGGRGSKCSGGGGVGQGRFVDLFRMLRQRLDSDVARSGLPHLTSRAASCADSRIISTVIVLCAWLNLRPQGRQQRRQSPAAVKTAEIRGDR